MITEDQLEQLCLDWFRSGGYTYAFGPDIAFDGDTPERSDYLQVVLTGRLLAALQKINPHIPLTSLEEAALSVTKPESPVLIHNNRAFHKLLLEGIPVEYRNGHPLPSPLPKGEGAKATADSNPRPLGEGGQRPGEGGRDDELISDHVQLIDFHNVEKNQFLVVNQFTVQGASSCAAPISSSLSTACRPR